MIATCWCLLLGMRCKFAGTFFTNVKGLGQQLQVFWFWHLLISMCKSFVTNISLRWVVPQCICSVHSAAAINDVIALMIACAR